MDRADRSDVNGWMWNRRGRKARAAISVEVIVALVLVSTMPAWGGDSLFNPSGGTRAAETAPRDFSIPATFTGDDGAVGANRRAEAMRIKGARPDAPVVVPAGKSVQASLAWHRIVPGGAVGGSASLSAESDDVSDDPALNLFGLRAHPVRRVSAPWVPAPEPAQTDANPYPSRQKLWQYNYIQEAFSGTAGAATALFEDGLVVNGEMHMACEDIDVRVEGVILPILRWYRSGDAATVGAMGHGWNTNIKSWYEFDGTDIIVYYEGRPPLTCIHESGSEYTCPPGYDLWPQAGNVVELTTPNDVKYLYAGTGRLSRKTLRTDQVFEWRYDGSGNVMTIANVTGGGDDDVYTFLYDGTLMTQATDEVGGRAVEYHYDSSELTYVKGSCAWSVPQPNRWFFYDEKHRLTCASQFRNPDGALSNGQLTGNKPGLCSFFYDDSSSRVTLRFTTLAGASPYSDYGTIYNYDTYNDGSHYEINPFGGVCPTADSEYHTTRHYFHDFRDDNDRLTKLTNARDGTSYSYLYEYDSNGLVTRTTTPGGRVIDTPRTSVGRQNAYIVYDSSDPITLYQYEYDSAARCTKVTSVASNTLTRKVAYDYDADHNVLTWTLEMPGDDLQTAFIYDGNGNVLTTTDCEGMVTAYAYDDGNHVTRMIVDPSGRNLTRLMEWDAAGRLTRLTDTAERQFDSAFDYAGHGELTKYTDGNDRAHEFEYWVSVQVGEDWVDVPNHPLTLHDHPGSDDHVCVDWTYASAWGSVLLRNPLNQSQDRYYWGGSGRLDEYRQMDTSERPTIYAYYDELGDRLRYAYAYDAGPTKAAFFYDADRNLISLADALDRRVVYHQYDQYNRVTRTTDPEDSYVVFEHDRLGHVTRKRAYNSGNVLKAEVHLQYDPAGRMTRERKLADPSSGASDTNDRVMDLVYDKNSRILTRLTYLGGTLSMATAKIEALIYDDTGNVLTHTTTDAPTIAYVYDDGGRVVSQIVDPAGEALTTLHEYDDAGNATRTTRPDDTYVVYARAPSGLVTHETVYDSGDTAVARTETGYNYYTNRREFEANYIDPSRAGEDLDDDPQWREYGLYGMVTMSPVADSGSSKTSYWEYDYRIGLATREIDPAGNRVEYEHDDSGRMITRYELDLVGGSVYVTQRATYDYDDRGQATTVTHQGADGVLGTADDLAVTIDYDALGRQTRAVSAEGRETHIYYNHVGDVTRLIEDAGTITRYTDHYYDRAGRITRETGYPDATSDAQNTDYLYNRSDRLTKITYPDGGTTSFELDSVGRITRVTGPRGIPIDLDYDNQARVLTKRESTNRYWVYAYDAVGRATLATLGTSAGGDEIARTERGYDAVGRLTSEAQSIRNQITKTVLYEHDQARRITAQYVAGGSVTTIPTWTTLDQLATVSRNDDEDPLVDYDYLGGRVTLLTFDVTGNDEVTGARLYDGVGRMTRLTWDQTDNTLPDFSYVYDDDGRILTKTLHHRSNAEESYELDTMGRLTRADYAQRTGTHTWVYDDLGNQLTANMPTEVRYEYNEANEVTSCQGVANLYLYDAAGNLTYSLLPYGKYFYDAENRLTRVQEAPGTTDLAQYAYDAFGRRIEFIDDDRDVTKRYIYGDQERILQEYNAAGTPARQRYYIWGNYVDELLVMHNDVGTTGDFHPLPNHQWSPEALVDSDGDIVERYDYDAYGNAYVYIEDGDTAGWWDGDETTANQWADWIGLLHLFTGRELDSLRTYGNLPIYHYRARNYLPTLARFLQRDPAGYVDGMNLYQYVGSEPVMGLDPTGTFLILDFLLGASTAAGAELLYHTAMRPVYKQIGTDVARIVMIHQSRKWAQDTLMDYIEGALPDRGGSFQEIIDVLNQDIERAMSSTRAELQKFLSGSAVIRITAGLIKLDDALRKGLADDAVGALEDIVVALRWLAPADPVADKICKMLEAAIAGKNAEAFKIALDLAKRAYAKLKP